MTITLTRKIIILGLTLVVAVVGTGLYIGIMLSKSSTGEASYASYVADFSDDRKVLGFSHNTFVARVVKLIEHTDVQGVPVTLFEVEVIQNIKGNLKGVVTILQELGYIEDEKGNKKLSIYTDSSKFMEVGEIYLLATRYGELVDGRQIYAVLSHQNGSKLLSSASTLNTIDLKEIVQNDEKVQAFQEAYKSEILLEVDIQNNNTRNSYQSLLEDGKE